MCLACFFTVLMSFLLFVSNENKSWEMLLSIYFLSFRRIRFAFDGNSVASFCEVLTSALFATESKFCFKISRAETIVVKMAVLISAPEKNFKPSLSAIARTGIDEC